MKKIMFNDKYGLTEAVLEGRKTMTRRIVPQQYVPIIEDGLQGAALIEAQRHGDAFRESEVVAVAQNYKTVLEQMIDAKGGYGESENNFFVKYQGQVGWSNKMFVRADLMPHQIRITNIKVERLQDISEEDCIKEGILDTMSNRIYHYRYPNSPRNYINPREAFAALIDKVSGKGTWERNPYCFCYEFKLVK